MASKTTEKRTADRPASIDAQARLAEIMNDSPRMCSFDGTQWEVRALKPGTQWLIAQEAIKIKKDEDASFGDIIRSFATSLPSVARVIALCLLNDRDKIYGPDGKLSALYEATYETIMWQTDQKNWLKLLVEIIEMLDISCFFAITSSIQILRQRTTERKMTQEELRQSSPVPASGR